MSSKLRAQPIRAMSCSQWQLEGFTEKRFPQRHERQLCLRRCCLVGATTPFVGITWSERSFDSGSEGSTVTFKRR